jgi:hypothetical protein
MTKEQSEQLILSIYMKDIFEKSLKHVCKRDMLSNNTIKITEVYEEHFKIEFQPTHLGFLYSLFHEMGREYERREHR